MLPLQQNTISEQQTTESLWKVKLIFDGTCPLCVREVNFLKRKDGDRGLIKFVDIAAENYAPTDKANIDYMKSQVSDPIL